MDRPGDESEATSRVVLGEARQHARDLVGGLVPPYEAGRAIWAAALGASGSGRDGSHCWALWLLWGSLTDWVENKPTEAAEAEAAMRRAAAEWLDVVDDELRWRQYFERWLYDEMGYERKSPQTVYVELLDEGVEVWRPVEADVETGPLSAYRGPPPPMNGGGSRQGAASAANGASCPTAASSPQPRSRTDARSLRARGGSGAHRASRRLWRGYSGGGRRALTIRSAYHCGQGSVGIVCVYSLSSATSSHTSSLRTGVEPRICGSSDRLSSQSAYQDAQSGSSPWTIR